jgi:hypothetical protein
MMPNPLSIVVSRMRFDETGRRHQRTGSGSAVKSRAWSTD